VDEIVSGKRDERRDREGKEDRDNYKEGKRNNAKQYSLDMLRVQERLRMNSASEPREPCIGIISVGCCISHCTAALKPFIIQYTGGLMSR
jgi:hypothetical protein